MAVYKQNNKYYYRGKYKNALGEYVQYNRLAKGARLKKEAQRMEEIFILSCQNKIEALTSITFEELTKMYVYYAAKKVKSSSLKTDNYLIGKINKDIGLYKVNMLDKYTLQKYVDNFYNTYSYTYAERLFYVLKKVYKYAVTIGLVNNNPMDNVILSTNHEVIKDDINYWTLNQFNIFIGYVDYGLYYVIYNFLYYMGCRKGDDDDKIRLNQRKPSKYKGLSRFGPEKNLQRINKFMKERPTFYKKLIQMKENFRFYLRCFYCITKVVILQFNSEKQDRISS